MGLVLGGDLQDCVDFIWSVSDCEELSGGIQNCPPAIPNLNTVFAGPS